jgi:hypothetical protein
VPPLVSLCPERTPRPDDRDEEQIPMLFKPRQLFGRPYAEVMAVHHANVAALAPLRAAHPGPHDGPLLTERPAAWSLTVWGDYVDDIAEELRDLREQHDTTDEGEIS